MSYARHADDWYVEPESVTETLLRVEALFEGDVLDPCCGGGNVVRALRRAGVGVRRSR